MDTTEIIYKEVVANCALFRSERTTARVMIKGDYQDLESNVNERLHGVGEEEMIVRDTETNRIVGANGVQQGREHR